MYRMFIVLKVHGRLNGFVSEMEKFPFKCVECHEDATELHRDYKNGILKLTICVSTVSLLSLSMQNVCCVLTLLNT